MRWGFPCSALFHSAIVALVLLTVPEPRKPKALPKEIPVEVVRKVPEKKAATKTKPQVRKKPPKPKEKKPIAKKEPAKPPKPLEKKPVPEEKLALLPKGKATEKKQPPKEKPASPPEKKAAEKKATPEPAPPPKREAKEAKAAEKKATPEPAPPPKMEAKEAKAADKPALVPEGKKPPAPSPAEPPRLGPKTPHPAPAPMPPLAEKDQQLALGPRPPLLRPKPAPPPKPKSGSLKVPPQLGAVPQPNAKKRKLLGQWILHPLTLDIGHRCGMQRVTGTMNLVNRRVLGSGAEIQYLAEIRTTIYWERCRPEGALRKLVLIRRGDRVFLVGANGVMDHGLMRGNVMILRDSLGDSYWHLSK